MNYTECLNYIHSLMRFGSRPGLERISDLLHRLGDPQEKLDIIHVAGTNGKGSTCTFLSNILRASGKKTGLYISPFVTVFNERIQINGQPIPDDDLAAYTERVKAVVDEMPDDGCPITEFEFITAVAFLYFLEQGCDAVVLEVGLGGRLDATNTISKPKASVIARIALDHTSILGNTESEIAFEKCGIVKKDCPVVTTADNSVEALNVIKSIAKERGCELKISNRNEAEILSADIFGSDVMWKGERYHISLPGEHQVSNALNAVTAVRLAFPEITLENIKQGLSTTVFPARCEVISKSPLVILDGSHNPNGTGALADLLEKTNIENATAIVGFMADKDVSDALSLLKAKFKRMITVKVESNSRTMTAEDLKSVCESICADVVAANSYEKAIELVKGEDKVIVFGSLYLAGDIRPLLLQHFKTKTN